MRAPVVTVLVPTYRRPQLLARALRSLQAQTWRDLTVLVCDNDSGDTTGEVVADFIRRDVRIRYHRHHTNLGPQANFGWAFSQVRTEHFCMLSDDDILLPGCLEIGMRGLRQHPQAMAWGGLVLLIGERGFVASMPAPGWPDGFCPPEQACRLVCGDVRPQNTGLLFRSAVLDAGFHPGHPDFHASDVLWTLHAAAKGGIGVTRVPVAVFTQHPGSTSTRAGHDIDAALQMLWPSVRYLRDHFPRGVLSEADAIVFRRQLVETYGTSQFGRLGRLAHARGLNAELARCLEHLGVDLQDAEGARRLRRLTRIPGPMLRLYDSLRHRLSLAGGRHRDELCRQAAPAAMQMLERYAR